MIIILKITIPKTQIFDKKFIDCYLNKLYIMVEKSEFPLYDQKISKSQVLNYTK